MCGIIAYKGRGMAAPILVEGLRTLEYRGYDSAGIASLHDGRITLLKGVGKVADVDARVGFTALPGSVGIAHTRWATTGAVTDANAHPHLSADGGMAIVQNGIVENYQALRAGLEREGVTFRSETDTEVIVALIARERKTKELLPAVRAAFKSLHGRNAFVVLDASGAIVAAKRGSPLILGVGKDALFLASDASPLLAHTRDVVFLDDGELVVLDEGYAVYDAETLARKDKKVDRIMWTVEQAQKGNYPHYMLKEIMEQRTTIADAIAQDPALIRRVADAINGAFGTYVVGCGTAGKVALASTYAFSRVARKHLNHAIGSEFPTLHDFLTAKSLLIAISQSGETADTLEAIEVMREKKGQVISLVNALGSTMDRVSDMTVPVHAGPEKSVCSTKATTAQMAIMTLLAYAVDGRYDEGVGTLKRTASAVDTMLTEEFSGSIRDVAARIKDREDMYIIGRGQNYPMALEAAIKVQEVAYIHAEGFAGGELKHGPIALIAEGTPLIALVANDETKEDTISNALEVKARGGLVIGVAPEENPAFDIWIPVPDMPETSPIVNIIPVQLLAYHLAVLRGNDVDMPRNLAKSVTVK